HGSPPPAPVDMSADARATATGIPKATLSSRFPHLDPHPPAALRVETPGSCRRAPRRSRKVTARLSRFARNAGAVYNPSTPRAHLRSLSPSEMSKEATERAPADLASWAGLGHPGQGSPGLRGDSVADALETI